MTRTRPKPVVICPYCQERARLVTGEQVYPHRRDLYDKRFYACPPCGAWVGVHVGTFQPLGRLANEQLRKLKMHAHARFDPLWKSGRVERSAAYVMLAEALGIPGEECHIGMFDEDMCMRVVNAIPLLQSKILRRGVT